MEDLVSLLCLSLDGVLISHITRRIAIFFCLIDLLPHSTFSIKMYLNELIKGLFNQSMKESKGHIVTLLLL